jgi:thiopurine S-methyltransferase
MNKSEENYWSLRYDEGRTGWDIGTPSTPLKNYLDQLTNESIKILIPGAGNAYEAEYAWNMGFKNVHILDIAQKPLQAFKQRNSAFPEAQLHHGDFFTFKGAYDLILEQTFFCSFLPTKENRRAYAQKMSELLVPGGLLVGVLFNLPLIANSDKRPFGGTKQEYEDYFKPLFSNVEIEDCYNSIPPRAGNEFFIQLKK